MNRASKSDVTAVVIARNAERFLAEALRSIKNQTLQPLEIIVVDGSSTDRTSEIARADPAVRYLQQSGRGIPNAYNQAIAAAQGSLIAFLSADDRWRPNKLQRQVSALQASPRTSLSISLFRYFLQPGSSIPPTFNRQLIGHDLVGIIMECLVARRELFQQVGLFDESLPVAEDVDWFARVKDLAIPIECVSQVLLDKRVHDCNASLNPKINTPALMSALRASIRRKRASADSFQTNVHSTVVEFNGSEP